MYRATPGNTITFYRTMFTRSQQAAIYKITQHASNYSTSSKYGIGFIKKQTRDINENSLNPYLYGHNVLIDRETGATVGIFTTTPKTEIKTFYK